MTQESEERQVKEHPPNLNEPPRHVMPKVDPKGDPKSEAKSDFYDVRVAVVGNVDSGKSTLIGVLTGGSLDNGRGLARGRVFVHRHEQANGRTSYISQHIMGFDENNAPVHQPVAASASSVAKNKSWREVVAKSRNLMTYIDLAGHERYLKTTIAGLTGTFPDYAIVVVGANMGITKMTREHLGVAIHLDIPVLCVLTKIDICPPNVLERTKRRLLRILKSPSARKKPFIVNKGADIETCLQNTSNKLCPVFLTSTVTGEGLDLLNRYLARLQPRKHGAIETSDEDKKEEDGVEARTEFMIDETFMVTGVGLVVSGSVVAGTLRTNSTLLLGPGADGTFHRVLVRSIHSKRTPVPLVETGFSCAANLRPVSRKFSLRREAIRRGMVLVDASHKPSATWRFEAEVLVLHHPTTIKENYQAVVHCGMVRQSAKILKISRDCLRTGDKAVVTFEFMCRPEIVHVGQTILFREGSTKGVGIVSCIKTRDETV